MRLPKNLLTKTYKKPDLFLCETDKRKICQLEDIRMNAVLKFNSYSELDFEIGRYYTNTYTGETTINPFYEKIDSLRLVDLDGFGYFEIQDPEITSDGYKEIKHVKAYSYEYTLSQKYIENFKVNTGETDSLEVIYANDGPVVPIVLYNEQNPNLSLLNLILTKAYGWKIGYVDEILKNKSRIFDTSRSSIYDFLVKDICEKFNCFIMFDTYNNTINVFAESLVENFIGDSVTSNFKLSKPYDSLSTVTIDGYKTTNYVYDNVTGIVHFNEIPKNGAIIEITDGSQSKWMTDVFVSFDNLAQEVKINSNTDNIKTILTVKGGEDLDIREVNMGLPYIFDLSYYYSIDWMGQDLYDAFTRYLQTYDKKKEEYLNNFKQMNEIQNYIKYYENRLSLQYSVATNVTSKTVGTYYVRGGTDPDFYYTEVKLPDEYNAKIKNYYMLGGTNLNEDKFYKFYNALKVYFKSGETNDVSELEKLKEDFIFVTGYTLSNLINSLRVATSMDSKKSRILLFLSEVWEQLGLIPLKKLYKSQYDYIKKVNEEAGWNDPNNENYLFYFPVTIICESIDTAITKREGEINTYKEQYKRYYDLNRNISKSISLVNNFTTNQLIRLSSFLREDEYSDPNFITLDSDSTEMITTIKKELLESGKIELQKISSPKLEFSMDMANIYALYEFEPIIDQFQLGRLIQVELRPDYIKKSRIMEIDIDFNDFSNFTCKFGELTSLRTPSSIHADLLANAMKAGGSFGFGESNFERPVGNGTYGNIQKEDIDVRVNIHNNDQAAHPFLTVQTENKISEHNNDENAHSALFEKINKKINDNISTHNSALDAHSNLFSTVNQNLENHNTDITAHANLKTNILKSVYPVGSIYMSVDPTSPAELFGGNWERIWTRMLIGADDGAYKAGTTGGEEFHKLVEKELPVIDGSWATGVVGQHGSKGVTGHAYGTSFPNIKDAYDSSSAGTQWGYGYKFGGNKPHNNMPPYLAVYMWKRVS